MKLYYMRDNHTFKPLPFNVDNAEAILRQEFDNGCTCGMLCATPSKSMEIVHAPCSENAEVFFQQARDWVQRAANIEHGLTP